MNCTEKATYLLLKADKTLSFEVVQCMVCVDSTIDKSQTQKAKEKTPS